MAVGVYLLIFFAHEATLWHELYIQWEQLKSICTSHYATVKDLDQSRADHLCGACLLLHKHFLLYLSDAVTKFKLNRSIVARSLVIR